MFTVCPKCALTLAITAADLRAGQGYVRCGRCSNVFNALLALSEEPGAATAPEDAMEAAAATPSGSTSSRLRLPIGHGGDPYNSEPLVAANEPETAVEEIDDTAASGVREFRGTGTYETIVLEGDGITQTEEIITEESTPEVADDSAPAVSDAYLVEEAPPARVWPWAAGIAALALLLSAQGVHHWRNQLAAKPAFNGPLTRLYGLWNAELTPQWDLGAYDVRQLGAGSGSGDAIMVRVSLANRSARAQPTPWLRLTLLDRFGRRVAARDLQPAEYLSGAQRGLAFLASDQRLDAEVAVTDPGPDAASFEVDVCLPGPARQLRCANDAAMRGSSG